MSDGARYPSTRRDGVSQDTPLAEMYAQARMLCLADGPDEVHKMTLARRELKTQAERRVAALEDNGPLPTMQK